jgi:S1-C subfamily serine protease
MDAAWDVAVIVSKLHAPALPLAEKAPNGPVFKNGKLDKPGDLITIIGYPYGLFERNVVIGRITSRMVPIDGYHPSDIYDATVAGGNSGSPVLKDGKIVGILWGSFIQSGHSLGVPWEAVVVALAPYAG